MIHKNANVGTTKNVVVVEFGNGTIGITNANNTIGNGECLLLKTIKKRPIGDIHKNPNSCDELEPDMMILFNNKKSFDVFFEWVLKVKNNFETFEQLDNE